MAEISRTLKPGGKLAFNTTFYDGSLPDETLIFYRKWMLKAVRSLRREYGLAPVKSERTEARRQLTPQEYQALVESNGFKISKQSIDTVKFTLEGYLDISTFADFIEGTMPGVPLLEASSALKSGARQAFEEMNVDHIPRNWLCVVATRV